MRTNVYISDRCNMMFLDIDDSWKVSNLKEKKMLLSAIGCHALALMMQEDVVILEHLVVEDVRHPGGQAGREAELEDLLHRCRRLASIRFQV